MILQDGYEERMAAQIAALKAKQEEKVVDNTPVGYLKNPPTIPGHFTKDLIPRMKMLMQQAQQYKPQFDCYVCTEDVWTKIEKEANIKIATPKDKCYNYLSGIDLFLQKTEEEAKRKAVELAMNGKKVCLIEEASGNIFYKEYVITHADFYSRDWKWSMLDKNILGDWKV